MRLSFPYRVIIKLVLICTKITYTIFQIFGIKVGKYKDSNGFNQIGFIDMDGLIHVDQKYCHLIHPNDLYHEGDFLPRKKFTINVYLKDNQLILEKNFKNIGYDFYNELSVLHRLRNVDCVPKIHYVDYKNRLIYMGYIKGYVLREKIAKLCPEIRDIYKKLNGSKLVIPENHVDPAIVVKDVVSLELLNRIRKSVEQIHREKVLIVDIKYGNIIVQDEKPFLIDFNNSVIFLFIPKFLFHDIKKSDNFILEKIFRFVS